MSPTRQLKQAAIDDADDGLPPPDQHRIMNSLCDVDPFRRTPAWHPAQNVRLAHSPHILNLQPPYGLGQNVFCPLGSRPRVRGSWARPTPWVMQTPLRPCPGSRAAPMRKAVLVKPSVCFQVSSRQTASRSVLFIWQQGNPLPVRVRTQTGRTRFPWAASFKLPAPVPLLRDVPAVLSFKPASDPSPIAGTAAAEQPRASPGARRRSGSRRNAGIGLSRPITRKTKPQDATQRP